MTESLNQLAAVVSTADDLESLTRPLLELLEAITGLESTYLTTVDEPAGVQRILFSRNTSKLQIPEGLAVPWGDTLCKRALEENRPFTDDVENCWGDSDAARALGIKTYLSQPVRTGDGGVYGTLCGASAAKVGIRPDAIQILGMFAKLIAQQVDREQALQAARRSGEEIQRYSERLQRSNHDLEQFAYVVSHDLQTPLTNIEGLSQYLQRNYAGKLDEIADEFLGLIMQSTAHMRNLISGVLELSRIGRQSDALETTDCEAVLAQVLGQLQSTISKRNALVTHDPLPKIPAVPLQVNLLLQNLIGNAIKFQRNEVPKVHISAQQRDGLWNFSVRDQGVGIKPEERDRIFQVFHRAHSAKEFEGTGIGLSICQRIVEHHGGRIWVESEVGKGSTFYFTLEKVTAAGR